MPKQIDETGNVYGKLTVIEESGRNTSGGVTWKCICTCGKTRIASGVGLRKGEITGCKTCSVHRMGHALINEVGHVHGRLTVLERAANDKWGKPCWKCRCACGNIIIVSGEQLRHKHTSSCGCLKRLPKGIASFRRVMNHIRNNARKRDLEFSLSEEDIYFLVQQPCYYCGSPASQVSDSGGNGKFLYNGLDRVDNFRGYILGNVVPCCSSCNTAKLKQSQAEFADMIKRIYHHWALTFSE